MKFAMHGVLGIAAVLTMAAGRESWAGLINPRSDQEIMQVPKGLEGIEKAIASFKKGDYDECFSILKTACAKDPKLFPAKLLLAKLFLMHNQAGPGRSYLEQVAAEQPGLPETYLMFARLAVTEGRLTDAMLHFEKAATQARLGNWDASLRKTFLVDAAAGLASLAERRKDWAGASTALASWLDQDPVNAKVRQRWGRALFRQGQQTKAFQELQRAASEDKTLEAAEIIMGQLSVEEKSTTKAREWLEKAIDKTPNSARAHLAFASFLLEQNQLEQASAEVDSAARLNKTSQEVKFLRGLIAWYQKDYDKAEAIFQDLYLDAPANVNFSDFLALSLVEQKNEAKTRRALQLAEINARLYPNSGEAFSTLGLIYYRQGKLEEAEQTLRTALAKGNASSDTAFYLARLLNQAGKADEVKTLLKLALEAPGHFSYRKDAQAMLDQVSKKS